MFGDVCCINAAQYDDKHEQGYQLHDDGRCQCNNIFPEKVFILICKLTKKLIST